MEDALEVAKTKAADAGKIKGEFLSKMSRELRTPLDHIIGFTELALEDGGEIRLSAHTVDCLVRSGRRCGDARDLKIIQECIKTNNMRGTQVSQCAEVAVSDTGIGLNAEDQKYIFEPFKQANESLNRRAHGAGIGLSLAKYLVELQGGKIWVESAGENKGSTFRFILPI